MIRIIYISILSGLLFLSKSWSEEFDNCSKPSIKLYFANGMFNSHDDAKKNYLALVARFKSEGLASRFDSIDNTTLAINHDMNVILKLGQVIQQKGLTEQVNILQYLHHLDFAPSWFIDAIKKIAADEIHLELILEQNFDSDFKDQIENYKNDLSKEIIPLVVAHSQGNMYTNMVFSKLKMDNGEASVNCETFKVVSVANPSSYVAACGAYKTLESDFVIRLIPGSMKPNIANPNPGIFDHEFIKHYLDGVNSGPAIVRDVSKTLNSVKASADHDATDSEVGYYNFDLHYLLNYLNQKIDNKKPLTNGECVAYRAFRWFSSGYGGYICKERNAALFKTTLKDCSTDLEKYGFDAGSSSEGCFYSPSPLIRSAEGVKYDIGLPSECQHRLSDFSKDVALKAFSEAIGLIEFYSK